MDQVPTLRVYQHKRCGDETFVSGGDFHTLSNPFAFTSGTMCCSCNKAYSLREFVWTDTGGSMSARPRRLRAAALFGQKLLAYLVVPCLGALIGAAIAQYLQPGDRRAIAGGAAGGFAVCALVLLGPLMQLLSRVDYRQIQ